jgi:uncharacterized protein YaiL (DUF2058 family)
MSNPFQDQLLKTGLVTKKQVHKARQDKNKKNKQQHSNKEEAVDETKLKIQQAAEEKAKHDRDLNKRKEEQARQKSISIEINQLITSNCLARDENCEIVYNFEHNKKVNRIYINAEMKQQIIQEKLGIARIEGRYELIPQATVEKIRQRNEKRVVTFSDEQPTDDDYSSAEHQIPDDLIW